MLTFGIVASCFSHVLPLFQKMTRASSLSGPTNAAFPSVLMQHLHSKSYRKFVKMGQVLSWMLTIVPSYVLQSPLNVGGLRAVVSGAGNTLVMHSVVLLWEVVVRCLSIQCDLDEEVTSAGSIFTSGARLIRGSGVPAMCCGCAVRPCCP